LKEIVEALPDDLSDDGIARIADFIKLIRDQEELRKRNWQTTVEAMEAARRGEHVKVEGIEGLMTYCMRTTMRTLSPGGRFRRDHKRETKGKSADYVDKLDADLAAVVAVLAADGMLDDRHRDHALSGEWKDHRDCHVRPDLVLICKPDDDTLELVRLGSHSELGLS
jgi:mRNA interferase YafQ